MAAPSRGEVWLVDLGMAAKVRPCLVLSIPVLDSDRALATMVAHTTSPRGTRFEVSIPAKFLKSGVFDVQNLTTIPHGRFIRRLGLLGSSDMSIIDDAVRNWLGLDSR